jgi:hypothetical protein
MEQRERNVVRADYVRGLLEGGGDDAVRSN